MASDPRLTGRWLRLLMLIGVFVPAAAARAEFRHALVIGNGAYPQAALASPPRDAKAVAAALEKRGFTVTLAENLAAKEMVAAARAFGQSIPLRGTAVVYFAGYAVPTTAAIPANPRLQQPAPDTVLLPIDGDPLNDAILGRYGTSVRQIVEAIDRGHGIPLARGEQPPRPGGSATHVVIVDGCYPHPSGKPGAATGILHPESLSADSVVIYAAPFDTMLEPVAEGLSPLASKLVKELASSAPLDKALLAISPAHVSSLGDRLAAVGAPASAAVSPPTILEPGTRVGDEWVNDEGIVFCWCPPGSFMIGSNAAEPGRMPHETQTPVGFPQGFWMAKYEFTLRDALPYGIVRGVGDHKLSPVSSFVVGSIHKPNTAPTILKKLNERAPEGWVYDIPTEAEWEYAARAGTTTAYSFGDDPADLPKYGNFADKSLRETASSGLFNGEFSDTRPQNTQNEYGTFSYAHKSWNDGVVTTARVGSYLPNPWGLHDVHGNVTEITSTFFHPERLVIEKPDAIFRRGFYGMVGKGGSWISLPSYCRSAFRAQRVGGDGGEAGGEYYEGFRIMLRAEGVEPPGSLGPARTQDDQQAVKP